MQPGLKSLPEISGNPFNVSWRIRDPFLVVIYSWVLLFFLFLFCGIAFVVWAGLHKIPVDSKWMVTELNRYPFLDLFLILESLVLVLLLNRVIFRSRSAAWCGFFHVERARADVRYGVRLFFKCLVLSLGLVAVITLFILGVALLLHHRDPHALIQRYTAGLHKESRHLLTPEAGWFRLIPIVFLGPWIEEVLFRGCLYGALRRRFSPWAGNIIASGIFAIAHQHVVFGLPNIFLLGLLTAYAYERTRSLTAPVLVHILWNMMCFSHAQPMVLLPLGMILLGLFLWSRPAPAPVSRAPAWGWKLYAWFFVALYLWGYVRHPAEAWEALLELPAYVALFVYAYDRPVGSRQFWTVYGFFYIGWVVFETVRDFGLEQIQGHHVAGMVFVWLIVAPSIIVLWRLATRPADDSRIAPIVLE